MNIRIRRSSSTRTVPGFFSVEDQPGADSKVDKDRAASWPEPRRHDRIGLERPWWRSGGRGADELRTR